MSGAPSVVHESLAPAEAWVAPQRLAGPRVLLRPVDPVADVAQLFAGSHGSPEREAVWDYLGYGPFPDPAALVRRLEECAASRDPAYYCVVDRATGRRLGMTSYLRIASKHRCIEIGHIWYIPEAQRTHVNTEACMLLLTHAFETLGYRRVEWKCDAANMRSHKAALRLGFRYEGTFHQHRIIKGRNRDTAWFAILDGDWPTVRARLVGWIGQESAPTIAG